MNNKIYPNNEIQAMYVQGYINNTRVDNLNKIVDDVVMSNAQW